MFNVHLNSCVGFMKAHVHGLNLVYAGTSRRNTHYRITLVSEHSQDLAPVTASYVGAALTLTAKLQNNCVFNHFYYC